MLPKIYDPKPVEEKLIRRWHEKKLFASTVAKTKKPFVMVIPPPNITGALHMGHALNNTLQDVLVRYHRMRGKSANWVVGTDHGGIATQNVIEKNLSREKKVHRNQLGREKFLRYAWDWYKECGGTILNQLKKLGCALDLTPQNVCFTMDEKRTRAVMEAFGKLWNKKYIYRGKRMINWCVRCTTALSDIEVEHQDFKSKLHYVHYPAEKGSEGITLATTRPETMFGDTAVAVNPKNKNYARLVGKRLQLPLTDRLIPVIADDEIDLKFGTGALKITPAHDPRDYEIGGRHNLEIINTISPEGKMMNTPKKYLGLTREQCKKQVLTDLEKGGYLKKEEPYKHAVGTCYRCHQPIEPAISEQWFVKMKNLAEPASCVIKKGKVKLHPESWKKPMLDWLANIEDWCISRQIWWGHRIPVWYCKKCSKAGLVYDDTGELVRVEFEKGVKPVVSVKKPDCPDCGGSELLQDPDVLDTWFSSALWPFSVFGWPQKTTELKFFYPTSVLSTGYEILYLWVARMVIMGLEFMGDIPFGDVYLHGIIRDKAGKKMSKSLGNVIDPLDLMHKYGTDAVRFALVSQAYPGKDIPFGESSIIGARNFCNKIYNATRFLLMNLPKEPKVFKIPEKLTDLSDRWILEKYGVAIGKAAQSIENFDLADACNILYHFLWGDFCDWYLELAKPRLQTKEKDVVLAILVNVLYGTLKALHPVMPFITEELAESLKPYICPDSEFLIDEEYPKPYEKIADTDTRAKMDLIMGVITALRTIRSHFHISNSEKIPVVISAKTERSSNILRENSNYIAILAKTEHLEIGVNLEKVEHSYVSVFGDLTLYVFCGSMLITEEKKRLAKEIKKTNRYIIHYKKQLDNPNFINNAPKEKIEQVKNKLEKATHKIKELKDAMEWMP